MIFSTPHHPNSAQLHNPLLSAAFTSVVHSIATDVPRNPKQVARHLIYAMNISVYARLRPISRRFDFLMLSCNQIANRQRCNLCFRLRPAPCPPPGFLSFASLSRWGAGDATRAGRTFLGPSRNCLRFVRDVIVPIRLYLAISYTYAARVLGIAFLSSFTLRK